MWVDPEGQNLKLNSVRTRKCLRELRDNLGCSGMVGGRKVALKTDFRAESGLGVHESVWGCMLLHHHLLGIQPFKHQPEVPRAVYGKGGMTSNFWGKGHGDAPG